jgi:hypothetical protein
MTAPRPVTPTQHMQATLEAQEWNIILAGLGELPLKISGNISNKLMQQLTGQMPQMANGMLQPEAPEAS